MTSQSCARTNAIRPAFVSHMAREFTMYAALMPLVFRDGVAGDFDLLR